MNFLISIITVTHNSERFLPDYFDSIIRTDLFQSGKVEVLIYDAKSKDKTAEIITGYQKKYDAIKTTLGNNVGFAEGNNLLARQAQGYFLFILNPDTKIENITLESLIADEKKEHAILIPRQVSFDNEYMSNGLGMDVFGFPYDTGQVFYADGAAIFLKKDLFLKLGMFDSDYYMFYEDIDLSWKAHLMGIGLFQNSEAIVYHYSGGSIDGGAVKETAYKTNTFRRYLNEKNLLQNIIKNYSCSNLLWILPIVFFITLSEIIFFLLLIKPRVSICYIKAYWWNFANIKTILKKRKWIQERRVSSDKIIMKKMYWGSAKLKFLFQIGIPKFENE